MNFNNFRSNKPNFVVPLQKPILLKFNKCHNLSKDLKKNDDDAGYDLHTIEEGTIKPGERRLFNTGVKIEIPTAYYGQIFARSSMAMKGIDVGAGVIDSGYRGLVKVLLINNGRTDYKVEVGDKIAQLVIIFNNISRTVAVVEQNLSVTKRMEKGFGSSGR